MIKAIAAGKMTLEASGSGLKSGSVIIDASVAKRPR